MIVRIKRQKYFSDNLNNPNQEKKGMGTGTKLLMGAATTAGLFYGARRGMLGSGLQMSTNRLWARGGHLLGSEGMFKSARTGYSQGFVKNQIKAGQGKFKSVETGSDAFKNLVSNQEKNLAKNSTLFGNVTPPPAS